MELGTEVLDDWEEVRAHLPSGFDLEATARRRGAFTRVREIKDAATLLRLALGYGACGMSLRQTCAWAAAGGIATLSDPALIERLEKAADWLGDIVSALLAEQTRAAAGDRPGYRLRAVDATALCEPGADRTTWRLHVGYDLASERIDRIDLTDGRGAESLNRFACRPGDILLADRGYARPRDLRPVLEAGADLIVRAGWNSLRLLAADGTPFDLFAVLAGLHQTPGDQAWGDQAWGETLVRVHEGAPGGAATADDPLRLRLVILRKTPEQAARACKRLLQEARKRRKRPDPRSLDAAHYILLLTSLPPQTFSTGDVLRLYRLRWQIELAFKRMKSLAGLDTLPAKKPGLARAWIHARLIAFLLAERMAGQVPDSPPCAPLRDHPVRADRDPDDTGRQPIPMAAHQDGAGQPPRRHPWTMPMERAPPRR